MKTTILMAVLVLTACSGPESAVDSALRSGDGSLRYRSSAYGRPVVEGRITIEVVDDTTITGSWSLQWSRTADTTRQIGPQIGEGLLSGRRLDDGRYAIDLNDAGPLRYRDNNVYLLATRGDHGWTGEWVWSTFTGPAHGGPFTAVPD